MIEDSTIQKDRLIEVCAGHTFLRFSPARKGALVSISFGQDGTNLVSGSCDLWVIEQAEGVLRSGHADIFEWEETAEGVVMTWGFDALDLYIEVKLCPQADRNALAASWSARCDAATGLCVNDIHFPRFRAADAVKKIIRPASTFWPEIPVEHYMQTAQFEAYMSKPVIHDSVCDADEYFGGLYPGAWAIVPFFTAWGEPGEGLYIGAHDADAYTKTILWDRRDICFTFHQPDPDVPRHQIDVPYPVVLAAFDGDWQDGADVYRNWACRHAAWCRRGSLAECGPEWARQSVAWFYKIRDAPLPMHELFPRLREVFGIEGPIGVHVLEPVTQDHSNMPIGEPEDWLRDYKQRQIRIAREHDYFVFEYRNAHKYTKDFPGYETARPHAFRWHGQLHDEGPYPGGPHFHNRYVPAGAPGSRQIGVGEDAVGIMTEMQDYQNIEMCMGTDYWRQKLLDAVMPCPAYGLIGNYLDQVGHNRNMSRCDAENHGHPLRGGNWYAQAHADVVSKIIRHYRLMGIQYPLLSHECFCEPLIGLLNAALLDGDLSLVSYLYHPYIFLESHEPYGAGYDGTQETMATLRRALARDFHTGRVPTLVIPCKLPDVDIEAVLRDKNDPADQPALRMIRHWFKVRSACLHYLNLGTMMRTPKLEAGSGSIITSAWQSTTGHVAVMASNATDTPQKTILDVQSLSADNSWHAWINDPQQTLSQISPLQCTLEPDDTLILETTNAVHLSDLGFV